MNSKNLSGWFLVLGPLTAFIFSGLLPSFLIETGTDGGMRAWISDIEDKEALTTIFTVISSIGWVSAFIGTVLLCDSMQGANKPGSVLARIGGIIMIGLAALAMVASMDSLASLNLLNNELGDSAQNKADAVVAQIVSRTIWTGLFFFWGIAFVLIGGALVIQKRLNSIVAWIFVVFGTLFVILSVTPIELAQNVGFLIFGIMSLNTVIAGVLRLRETDD